MKPTAYQLEKLATLNRKNLADVLELKARADGPEGQSVVGRAGIEFRARQLQKNIKAAARLERELGLHKKPAG